jgi:DNA-binding transcriptional LysR family regulator
MGEVMDRLLAMEVFVRVVEAGSFSKAAAQMATTQPTITRRVAAIESRLGVRLLNRNTRGVSLTETGLLYYDKCKSTLREAEEAESVVNRGDSRTQGLLRIGSSVTFGRRVVVPLALEFMAQHPHLQVDLNLDDRYSDPVAEGLDIALRLGKLSDSSLGARYIGSTPWLMVASGAYLRAHGTPKRPEDLSGHQMLIYSRMQGIDVWRVLTPRGETVSVPVVGKLRSNNISVLLAAAHAGLGIAMLPKYLAAASLAAGGITEVLEGHTLPPLDIHALLPSPRLVPRKVNVFIMFLQGKFEGAWWERLPQI